MKDFSTLYEEYMMMDKKTLAQLLAMRDFREQKNDAQTSPWDITPWIPQQPYNPAPIQPYYGGDWTITCML